MLRRSGRSALLATFSVVALVAAACTDDDARTAVSDVASTDSSTPLVSVEDRNVPRASPGEHHVEEGEGEPVHGGHLVYGLEADTTNPWAPFRTSCSASCLVLFSAVADPLFMATPEGAIAPLLVESFEPNDDFTEWTYHIREGIQFHDGTPLDGAAVEFNLESCQHAPLTGSAFTAYSTVESSGQDVIITTNGPAVALPYLTLHTQCAYMFSPTWLGTLEDIPQRDPSSPIYDAALAATPATGDPAKPIGSGAFRFESYTPGNGNSFRAVRNDEYWRGTNGITGEDLPYLDSIEGVVAVDIASRANSLRSGQFDVIHTSNADAISQFLDDDELETIATTRFGDTIYIMLNVAAGPETDPDGANADSPLLNVHCRRALAHAIDVDRVIDEREAGLSRKANGPFGPGMIGYLEDTGAPTYDPDAARDEMETCLSELGTDRVEFTFNTTNDPFNVESNQLIISMWTDVFGDRVDVTVTPIEQGQFLGWLLTGGFDALELRNHAGIDPDGQSFWWSSGTAAPIGETALNFGRFKDPEIDALLEIIHSDPDDGRRREAAEDLNRRFGEQVYNIWLYWVLWGIIEQPFVNGLERNVAPDGGEGVGLAFFGRHQMNQIWCDDGTCD